jgi:hypothetical protein
MDDIIICGTAFFDDDKDVITGGSFAPITDSFEISLIDLTVLKSNNDVVEDSPFGTPKEICKLHIAYLVIDIRLLLELPIYSLYIFFTTVYQQVNRIEFCTFGIWNLLNLHLPKNFDDLLGSFQYFLF